MICLLLFLICEFCVFDQFLHFLMIFVQILQCKSAPFLHFLWEKFCPHWALACNFELGGLLVEAWTCKLDVHTSPGLLCCCAAVLLCCCCCAAAVLLLLLCCCCCCVAAAVLLLLCCCCCAAAVLLLLCCCATAVLLLQCCCCCCAVAAVLLLLCCCAAAVLLLQCCCCCAVAAVLLLCCCCCFAVLLLCCCCCAAVVLLWPGLGQVAKLDQFLSQAFYNIAHPMPTCPKLCSGLICARWSNFTNSFYKPFITLATPCLFTQNLALAWFAQLDQIKALGQVAKLVQFLLQAFYNIGTPRTSWPKSKFWARWPNLHISFYKPFLTLALPGPAGPNPGFGPNGQTCTILFTSLL